jgi:hypothetical protein
MMLASAVSEAFAVVRKKKTIVPPPRHVRDVARRRAVCRDGCGHHVAAWVTPTMFINDVSVRICHLPDTPNTLRISRALLRDFAFDRVTTSTVQGTALVIREIER